MPGISAARMMSRCEALAACSEQPGGLTRVFLSPEQRTANERVLAQPFVRRPGQEHRVHALGRNAREVLGIEVKPHGAPLYTDARHYSEAGVPTVLYGAGPRTLEEANGHRADERLWLDDLYRATEVVALSLFDLLGSTK